MLDIKKKLIPDLVHVIQCKEIKTELHMAAAEILATLVDNDSSFRYVLKHEPFEYSRDVMYQLGSNLYGL